jgi:amino acid transporter/signal transduction histidine kinase
MGSSVHGDVQETYPPHPRKIGWVAATALAMGGSNQSLFIIGALFAGQGAIPGQGSAAVPLLIIGLILSYMAMPGWTELCCMFPNRVGGIAATCAEAFRPYSPILANLAGMCYWWGWVPTCGLTALFSAAAIQAWLLPGLTGAWVVPTIAVGLVLFFAAVNLLGVQWISRLAVPIATVSASLAFLSAVIPVITGKVDWVQAGTFSLTAPFEGIFGKITSAMAGLYLIGFAAPAFEAAYCHVGEMKEPSKNLPRAARASAVMAGLYFLVLPVVWLGSLGAEPLGRDLAVELGPTYAPLFGGLAKSVAMWFMMFNMFHGTMAPTAGVCRTLSQLAEDGLMPKFFAKRNRYDAPFVATLFTAACAIVFLLMGDPIWLVAAANLTYLIGITLPSVAVWLLRRDCPNMERPYKAARGMIGLGVFSATSWGIATVLGFEQFGLPTVLFGIALAYSGAFFYAWRKWSDRRAQGLPGVARSLHVKLTGAMLLVLVLDGAGYLMAIQSIPAGTHPGFVTALEDIFVAVALLTISVGLVLPGMIAHSAVEVSKAATSLVHGTLADFTRAMQALAAGRLADAHARIDIHPVTVNSRDEVGEMAENFNTLQEEVRRAAVGLDGAREGLRAAREELQTINAELEQRVAERTAELKAAQQRLVDAARRAGKAEIATSVLHNVGNVLNSVNVSVGLVNGKLQNSPAKKLGNVVKMIKEHEGDLGSFLTEDARGKQLPKYLEMVTDLLSADTAATLDELTVLNKSVEHIKRVVSAQQANAAGPAVVEAIDVPALLEDALNVSIFPADQKKIVREREYAETAAVSGDKHMVLQILINLISNAKHAVLGSGQAEKRLTFRVGTEETEKGPMLRVQIEDNGVGISPENLTRIFNHGFTTKADGHGFGLHAAANAAHQMGGSLTAASAGTGRGATFTLDLPFEPTTIGAAR